MEGRALEVVIGGALLIAWAWLFPVRTLRGRHSGVWHDPPTLLRRLLRRGVGDLHVVSVAGQVWGYMAIVGGLLAIALNLDPQVELAIVVLANSIGIAIVLIAIAYVLVMDRRRR
jgi:hypothetical protein